jgi:Asp-tRNA(Asn)/Glu-tRNA(Gln) amidotransferase A subunit family amidase
MAELYELTAADLAARIKAREVSAGEVTDAFLARIEAVETSVRSLSR